MRRSELRVVRCCYGAAGHAAHLTVMRASEQRVTEGIMSTGAHEGSAVRKTAGPSHEAISRRQLLTTLSGGAPTEKTTLLNAAQATLAAASIPGVPPFSAPRNEISIDADVDRTGATSLPTLIEAH